MSKDLNTFLKGFKITDIECKPGQELNLHYNSETFKYFSNGKHVHHIKYLPQLCKNENDQSGDGKLLNTFLNKDRGLARLSNYVYKKFKPENIEESISLLPSPELKDNSSNDPKIKLPISGKVTKLSTIPEVVNSEANINVKQLRLITKLSQKMNNVQMEMDKKHLRDGNYVFKYRYGKLLSEINKGSFGEIKIFGKKIEDSSDIMNSKYTYCSEGKIFYAVKEFKPKKTDISMETYKTNIISEFIIGNSFFDKCPNILNVFNLMQLPDSKFIQVMELCPCGDLYNYIQLYNKRHHRIHALEADCFLKQVLNAVGFMHIHGIAHCDIKLENILLYPQGLLKLCDFGSSSVFQTAWESGIHKQKDKLGTQPYLAPEEHKDEPYDPQLSDCWSCGVVYMTMVLGHYMWMKASLKDDMSYEKFEYEMKNSKRFHIFEGLSHYYPMRELFRKRVLYKIFNPDPNERITVIQLLNTPWINSIDCCQE